MSEELARYEAGGAVELLDPERVLGEAQKAAQALTRVISSKPKKVMIRGEHYIEFDISGWNAGIYYYVLEFNGDRLYRKMVITK